jgi:hypothetical protein
MIRCECQCVCCDTQVFILPDAPGASSLFCPSCGRRLQAHKIEPFGAAHWPTCDELLVLTSCRRGWPSVRKCRLFACACCRLTWTDPSWLDAVGIAERLADGLAWHDEVEVARKQLRKAAFTNPTAYGGLARVILEGFPRADAVARVLIAQRDSETIRHAASLFRDIAGNPFRPPQLLPPAVRAWNDGIVLRLARGIDEEGAFERLPILADALEEASCTDADLLGHCRSPEPHTKGCWAVDLLTGRE